MKTTITVQIGNSDDKLTQRRWSDFVEAVDVALAEHGGRLHFHGLSPADARWQNACWVAERDVRRERRLIRTLERLAAEFGQEAIAFTVGRTAFIAP